MGIGNLPIGFCILSLFSIGYSQINDYAFLSGPYCENVGCCDDRHDQCTSTILDTSCYCDEFCNRTINSDCCPDFWSHCKGISLGIPTTEPPPQQILACEYNNHYFGLKETYTENCNTCKCEQIGTSAVSICEQDRCLVDAEVIQRVNERPIGWTATNYSQFWGKKLEEGLVLRLGTLLPQRLQAKPVTKSYDERSLPREFEASQKWPAFWISGIQDQGWCGSSWAISSAAIASDRFAILSNGSDAVTLSAEHLLSCDKLKRQSCKGGYLDIAWNFVRQFGLVDEQCFPYTAKKEQCRIARHGTLERAGCQPPRYKKRQSYFKVGPAYRIGSENDIMSEILQSGPVQATMRVYHDFFTYKDGIYEHLIHAAHDNHRQGYHSVRIVGWGEENTARGPKKYWKVANSWGTQWGENGFFRILRGSNECEIESFVLGVWPDIDNKLIRQRYH